VICILGNLCILDGIRILDEGGALDVV
jgi:hypothetical protein